MGWNFALNFHLIELGRFFFVPGPFWMDQRLKSLNSHRFLPRWHFQVAFEPTENLKVKWLFHLSSLLIRSASIWFWGFHDVGILVRIVRVALQSASLCRSTGQGSSKTTCSESNPSGWPKRVGRIVQDRLGSLENPWVGSQRMAADHRSISWGSPKNPRENPWRSTDALWIPLNPRLNPCIIKQWLIPHLIPGLMKSNRFW